jgi:hypothetical protein
MVQRLAPALGGGDGDVQVVLNLFLANKIIETTGSQTRIEGYVLFAGFT